MTIKEKTIVELNEYARTYNRAIRVKNGKRCGFRSGGVWVGGLEDE